MIPYSRQIVDEDDIRAVTDVLKGRWLTQGPAIEAFEQALADHLGARHAVAFSSGTAALHAAALAAGIGPGDLVVTSPLSFVASANCARYVGATPVFVDIDPVTLNLDLNSVPTSATGIVAVHFAGLAMDLSRLTDRPHVVIEDAAHALGAITPDGPVGNCAHSDMCAFSFHPVKAVTTGEGGAVTTNSIELAEALRRIRNHGIAQKPDVAGWYYEVETLGFNYRITDIQAAMGLSQLTKLERFVARRNELADRYRQRLDGLPIDLPPAALKGCRHAYHLFPVRIRERRRVYDALKADGIGVQVHYIPIYRHPFYAQIGLQPQDFPNTEAAYASLLSIPLYPSLLETEQDRVIELLEKYCE